MSKWVSRFMALVICLVFLNACAPPGPPTVQRIVDKEATTVQKATEAKVVEVVRAERYSETFYYFPHIEKEFAHNFVSFTVDHPELDVVTITGDGAGSYGRNQGHFVVFKKKIVPEVK